MNVLKTVANQVITFGTYIKEEKCLETTAKYYRIDTVTQAIIFYTKDNKIKKVSFIYR